MATAISLKERAYDEIRRLIIRGEAKPREGLTEKMLTDKLIMSRTPIRAALERLEVEGLVSRKPNKGLIVAELSLQKAVDFFDFRIAIEAHVAPKLSGRAWDARELEDLKQNLELQRRSVELADYVAFTEADSEFFRLLATVYDNAEIVQTMENLQDKLFLIALKVLRKDNRRIGVSYQNHVNIYDAMTAGTRSWPLRPWFPIWNSANAFWWISRVPPAFAQCRAPAAATKKNCPPAAESAAGRAVMFTRFIPVDRSQSIGISSSTCSASRCSSM